ncbi:unnamed protein product, partial [Didymodactylos carnosus]
MSLRSSEEDSQQCSSLTSSAAITNQVAELQRNEIQRRDDHAGRFPSGVRSSAGCTV